MSFLQESRYIDENLFCIDLEQVITSEMIMIKGVKNKVAVTHLSAGNVVAVTCLLFMINCLFLKYDSTV